MARPLPSKRLEKMDLTVKLFDGSSKKLGKQVGYNKYIVDEESHKIAMLVEKLEKEGDALLTLEDHGKDKPVIKIVENLFQTADKPYAYVLDENGKVKFLDEGVSVYDTNPDVQNAEQALEEINQIPEGGKGGADVEGSAEFTSSDNLNISGKRDVTVNVEEKLTLDAGSASVEESNDPKKPNKLTLNANTVDFKDNALTNNNTAVISISEGGEFGSDAIVTSGDKAETTIQGGK